MSNTKHNYPKGYIPPRMQTSTPAPSLATGLGAKEGKMGTPGSRTWAPLGPAPAKRFPYPDLNRSFEERKKDDELVAEEHLKADEEDEQRTIDALVEQDEYAQKMTQPKPLPKVPSIREVLESGPTARQRAAMRAKIGRVDNTGPLGPEDDEEDDAKAKAARTAYVDDLPKMSAAARIRHGSRMR